MSRAFKDRQDTRESLADPLAFFLDPKEDVAALIKEAKFLEMTLLEYLQLTRGYRVP